MYNQLLLQAFDKAGEEIHSDVVSRQAVHLSDVILEYSGMPYGERSLRDRYKEAQNDININLNLNVADALSIYLGYKDYSAFVAKQHQESDVKNVLLRKYAERYKHIILIGVISIIVFAVYKGTKTRWMVWETDHYIEVSYNKKLLQNGRLKIYNKDRIDNFKKISADCSTSLVFNGGNTKLWYGKNRKGDLEFFTTPGLHPETGKTLKELTKYMYDKYICVQ